MLNSCVFRTVLAVLLKVTFEANLNVKRLARVKVRCATGCNAGWCIRSQLQFVKHKGDAENNPALKPKKLR